LNIAFTAVVIFLLAVPGIIFRSSYFTQPFTKKFASGSPSDQIALSIVPALLLHLGMLAACSLVGYHADFRILGTLLVGGDPSRVARAFRNIQANLPLIAAYNVLLWIVAGLAGWGSRVLILNRWWDLRFPTLFRLENEWFYIITGRQWALEEEFDFVWVDALVGAGDEEVIYSGVPVAFYLDHDGGLETLYLAQTHKTLLGRSQPDKTKAERPEEPVIPPMGAEIDGKVFVIKYAQVVNLNFVLYKIHGAETAVEPEPGKTANAGD
jgi:hypothetical protein